MELLFIDDVNVFLSFLLLWILLLHRMLIPHLKQKSFNVKVDCLKFLRLTVGVHSYIFRWSELL